MLCKADLENLTIFNTSKDKSQLQVSSSTNIKVTLANIQSVKNKDLILFNYLKSNDTDVCILTETWLQNCASDELWLDMIDLNKNEYKMGVSNRINQLGGGYSYHNQIAFRTM